MRIDESFIITCRNLDVLKSFIEDSYPQKNLKLFIPEDDFLLQDAKNIIKEAYVAESEQKVIAAIARNYGAEAQNSLLKIVEEPPKNITFLLCAPSKAVFLPTIRSRLPLFCVKEQKEKTSSGLDFKKMGLGEIYDFLRDMPRDLDKGKAKDLLQCILNEAIEQGVKLSEAELEQFCRILYLAELNSPRHSLLLSALLCIYERKNR